MLKTPTPELKAKLSKILALQQSNNVNEAANAAALVEKICQEWDVSPSDVEGYDPEQDEAVIFAYGRIFSKQDPALTILVNAVANYFNGKTIISYTGNYRQNRGSNRSYRKQLKVVATAGNQLQIEIYTDYLLEIMEKLSVKHKQETPDLPLQYKNNFRKGFASRIAARLREMKEQQEKEGRPETQEEALVVINKNTIQQRTVNDYYELHFPRTRKGSRIKFGSGAQDGSNAAKEVGLNKQVNATKDSPKSLPPQRTHHNLSSFG